MTPGFRHELRGLSPADTLTVLDNPYRNAPLIDFNGVVFGYAIEEDKEADRLISAAACEAIERIVDAWIQKPGVVCCKFDIPEEELLVHFSSPGDDDHFATFALPLRELLLSAAITARDFVGLPPSSVSAVLRKLADDIDAIKED